MIERGGRFSSAASFFNMYHMRKIIFLCLAILFALKIGAQQPSKTFVADTRVYDFGKILEKNGKVTHTFHFTNRGKQPVVINDITAWCGCTTYSYTKTPIRPGKQGTVSITYNPNYRPGFFSKEIVVLVNGGKEYTRIWVKGHVTPYVHPVTEDYPYSFGAGLYAGMKVLPFGSLHKGEHRTIEWRYANDTDKPMTLSFKMVPRNINLIVHYATKIAAKGHATALFYYHAPAEYSYDRYITLYPVVNGKVLSKPIIATFSKL
jgi:hypothetical protein